MKDDVLRENNGITEAVPNEDREYLTYELIQTHPNPNGCLRWEILVKVEKRIPGQSQPDFLRTYIVQNIADLHLRGEPYKVYCDTNRDALFPTKSSFLEASNIA